MSGSPESASAEALPGAGKVLVCGVNWVGDTMMSMPAVEAFREAHPESHLTLLVKKSVCPLWQAHAAPDEVMTLDEGPRGTWRTARRLRAEHFDVAYIFPNSFRSALIPFLAGVPERVGLPGHARNAMLTRVVSHPTGSHAVHQAHEYFQLMAPEQVGGEVAVPQLRLAEAETQRVEDVLRDVARPLVGILPGASRGPSKRWPSDFFAKVGRKLSTARGCGVVLLGAPDERPLCGKVCDDVGEGAVNLAGETSMGEWMAALAACDLVLCNDSGGMHVASVLGTPVVAIFGQTDPNKTGPLGSRHCLLQESDVRTRDIARDSEAARKSLASVTPGQVYEAACELLDRDKEEPAS